MARRAVPKRSAALMPPGEHPTWLRGEAAQATEELDSESEHGRGVAPAGQHARLSMSLVNYPRRQQYRRLSKAGAAAVASATAGLMALTLASAGAMPFAGVLAVVAVALGLYARRWLRLAGRSRIGARSEDEVRRALASLEAEGWRLRHSLRWQGPGDIDSLAIAPSGVAVVIETKTRTYHDGHLRRVLEQAAWLSRRRRRWCRKGVVPMLCLVRARAVAHLEAGVIIVSIDRLTTMLRNAAETMHRDVYRQTDGRSRDRRSHTAVSSG